uniref:Uncharacterized protein n=1 Tax=Solanum lycopersicum TaxID=4081 RepID=K4BHC7_SOLLC
MLLWLPSTMEITKHHYKPQSLNKRSSISINLVNAPPREMENMLNDGEGTIEVRTKRPNVGSFNCCCSKSFNIGPFSPNHTCSFLSIQHASPLLGGAFTEWTGALLAQNPKISVLAVGLTSLRTRRGRKEQGGNT